MIRKKIYNLINEERDFQDRKWGADCSHLIPGDWTIILGEEFGEVCEALQRHNTKDTIAELVQVAAVCVKWIEEITRDES